MYEDVRYDGRVVSMAILIVCVANESGKREVLSIEPMLEESSASYSYFLNSLKERGLETPELIVSDAHKGLAKAIKESFPGSSWQRCKVHFMRNVLAHVSHREKKRFASKLKLIWQAPTEEGARILADELIETYAKRFPQATKILEEGLEESLSYYAFPALDRRKISSNNFMERLNREIRRRTKVIGIFPNPESYLRLVTVYLLEYTEEWGATDRAYLSVESLQTLGLKAA